MKNSRQRSNLISLIARIFLSLVVLVLILFYVAPDIDLLLLQKRPEATRTAVAKSTAQEAGLPSSPTANPTKKIPPSSTPGPTATTRPKTIWIDPYLPDALRSQIQIPAGFSQIEQKDQASVIVAIGNQNIVGHWIYALVTPFPSLSEGIQISELTAFWQGEGKGLYVDQPLYLDPETERVLTAWWGPPGDGAAVVLPGDKILDMLWPNPERWAIIPFQALEPRWKVLAVGGQKPIHQEYDADKDVLSIPISVTGWDAYRKEVLFENPSLTNRNTDEMTTILLTGVTALVRDTAALMEENGVLYPAEYIGSLLRSADLTHVSNEVPFASDCPPPDPGQPSLYFCSDDRYLELLDYIGTDIVELSGDHFGDWGEESMYHTLELYESQGWDWYGGGRNLEEGLQPLLWEHHGNRIAFIGCNAKGADKYATASDTEPGAAKCDFLRMREEIGRLKEKGYTVIATMQHEEIYKFRASHYQKRDFRSLAEAGADIVSGSQAHQPQAFDFHDRSFIHYGLGNLFFDQYLLAQRVQKYEHSDQAFIDSHLMYQGRHINTELFTIQFIDNAQSRFMTDEERAELLFNIFETSDW